MTWNNSSPHHITRGILQKPVLLCIKKMIHRALRPCPGMGSPGSQSPVRTLTRHSRLLLPCHRCLRPWLANWCRHIWPTWTAFLESTLLVYERPSAELPYNVKLGHCVFVVRMAHLGLSGAWHARVGREPRDLLAIFPTALGIFKIGKIVDMFLYTPKSHLQGKALGTH